MVYTSIIVQYQYSRATASSVFFSANLHGIMVGYKETVCIPQSSFHIIILVFRTQFLELQSCKSSLDYFKLYSITKCVRCSTMLITKLYFCFYVAKPKFALHFYGIFCYQAFIIHIKYQVGIVLLPGLLYKKYENVLHIGIQIVRNFILFQLKSI